MILSWMIYGSLMTLLLGLAALALEGPVRQSGRPVRGLWIAALAGALALPFLFSRIDGEAEPAFHAGGPSSSVDLIAPLPQSGTATWTARLQERTDPVLSPVGNRADLDGWLLRAWAIATTLLALAFLVSWLGLARRRREWRPAEVDDRSVLVSSDTGPAVAGLLRGAVVLPEWLMTAPASDRSLALLHEEEHVRARDPALLFAALLASILLPWNAPLWWVGFRLRRAVEIDCDLRVVARGADPRAYSRLLVEVMNHGSAHRLIVGALSETPSFLERRIQHMLTRKPGGWWMRASRAAAVAVVCVVSACRLDQPRDLLAPDVIMTDVGGEVAEAAPTTRGAIDTLRGAEAAEPSLPDRPIVAEAAAGPTRATVSPSSNTVQLVSRGGLKLENFMEFARVELADVMENGMPRGEAIWMAVDEAGTIRKRWIGPDLFIFAPDSLDPRSPARAPGSAEELRAKDAHHRAVESVLRTNVPDMPVRSAVTITRVNSFVLTLVSESPSQGEPIHWADRRPVDLTVRMSQPVTAAAPSAVEERTLTWRGQRWTSMQERIIRAELLQQVGEVDGAAIYAEVGVAEPRAIFQLAEAPNVFVPFLPE